MSEEIKIRLAEIDAPYRREVMLDEVRFESGMRLLRVTIREGHRITQLDLDVDTAVQWSRTMSDWASRNPKG